MLAGKDEENGIEVEHEGKNVWVNSADFGYEKIVQYIVDIMDGLKIVPNELIFVVEGKQSKARRVSMYSEYKATRDSRPPQAYEEFNKAVERVTHAFRSVGASIVKQDGVEGDDTLAYLCATLEGEKIVMSNDGDLAALLDENVVMVRRSELVEDNPLGPFAPKFIRVYKALVGDSSDNIKGAQGFGPKAFLDMLVKYGEPGLAGIEGMIKRGELHELEEDVADFKPFRKVIDSAEMVYKSYAVAGLYPEWVNTERQPLTFFTERTASDDERLAKWAGLEPVDLDAEVNKRPPKVQKNHAVFDTEIMGSENPVFLFCARVVETGETMSYWWHRDGDMEKLRAAMGRPDLTWISFNGINFDQHLISAALQGRKPDVLKRLATEIVEGETPSWTLPERFGYELVEVDHIDLIEVAPGVRISLKTYAGRMAYPTMIDLPFHHDQDLLPEQLNVVEEYCLNDLGVTEALFNQLTTELQLRVEMSEEYGLDLRSKSDAQVAEAVMRKVLDIRTRPAASLKSFVTYNPPKFIKTDNPEILELIEKFKRHQFTINQGNGSPENPDWLKDDVITIGSGTYQCGIGGLHSTHDKSFHIEATDAMLVSDFDVASYYPNIILKASLTPQMNGKGANFIAEYQKIYEKRMEAKRAGNKKVANSLKITLNGLYGKLGSVYSIFYTPELLLAVTLTGQLNLLCLIAEMCKVPTVTVTSANTDGIMVSYAKKHRDKVLAVIEANAALTGFDYEETPYSVVAMKDVNNYSAITTGGKVKGKGLYAPVGLMKNPTMEVCTKMAVNYLKTGVLPEVSIKDHTDMKDFVAIRNVKGGGKQPERTVEVDDWKLIEDLGTKDNVWMRTGTGQTVKRKSRPKPVSVHVGGVEFGRVARWYMTKQHLPPLVYVGSGNKVPKTEGAKICMTLPDTLPKDLDLNWYVNETYSMLADMGVDVDMDMRKSA